MAFKVFYLLDIYYFTQAQVGVDSYFKNAFGIYSLLFCLTNIYQFFFNNLKHLGRESFFPWIVGVKGCSKKVNLCFHCSLKMASVLSTKACKQRGHGLRESTAANRAYEEECQQ